MDDQPQVWNESDLQGLVTASVEESLELEYQAADAIGKSDKQKNEISISGGPWDAIMDLLRPFWTGRRNHT